MVDHIGIRPNKNMSEHMIAKSYPTHRNTYTYINIQYKIHIRIILYTVIKYNIIYIHNIIMNRIAHVLYMSK